MNAYDILTAAQSLEALLLQNRYYFEPLDTNEPDTSAIIINSLCFEFIKSLLVKEDPAWPDPSKKD